MTRPVSALAICVLALGPFVGSSKEIRGDNRPPPFVRQVLEWLPVDTETLIVSRGPFEIPLHGSEQDGEAYHALPAGMVSSIRNGMLAEQLKGQKVSFAIEGSRHFRPPKGLGMMPFEGCQVIQFEKGARAALKAAFRHCLNQADSKKLVADNQVAIFRQRWENDDWTLYVAQPQADTLVIATDLGFFQEVLRRMDGQAGERALPDGLTEWQQVNMNAPLWVLRHYRNDIKIDDPSSPFRSSAVIAERDPQAIGFVFWYDPKFSIPVTARYLSNAANAERLMERAWEPRRDSGKFRITTIASGVIELSAASDGDDERSRLLFLLLSYVGHGVYL